MPDSDSQEGGDGPTGIDFDKFTFAFVIEAEPVECELEKLQCSVVRDTERPEEER